MPQTWTTQTILTKKKIILRLGWRLVPELLDACPTKVIRAFYRKTWRYMDAYRKGLNAKQAEYAVKKYCSHRKVGAGIMMDMAILNNPE
ncbi:hypothetical protein BDR03DRAFT_343771 [Suillus americanus]|nr:hypothetical protein BDR03DRAFT_343771 [Suillus americanus]